MVTKGRILFPKLGLGVGGPGDWLSDGPLTRAAQAWCWSGDIVAPSGGRGTPLEAQEAG